jgi:cobalt-zinc-cadmium efflux system membrane fusion protein
MNHESNPPVATTLARCLALLLAFALGACGKSAAPASTEHAEAGDTAARDAAHPQDATHADDAAPESTSQAIAMNADAMRAAGIVLRTLAPGDATGELRAPGEVVDNAYGTTLITPRIAALVVRRHARLGDEVRAGAPLATLASVEVSDAQADLRIAEQEWRRVSALGTEAVSGRRIGEARIAVDRARAKAQAYGLPGTANGSVGGEFTLSAPHAGRITADDFVIGERIEPGRALFRLVEESTVWVDATLPSGTSTRIEAGSPVVVVAAGRRLDGKVLRISHRTSETTRNATVRVEVPNRDDALHAGDFVDVYLREGAGDARRLLLPTTALVQIEGETVAFRRNAAGALEAVAVRTGDVVGDGTVIEDGLKAGDAVVVEGAFALKARLLKAQLGEGHGH